jgi:hypothetical protein
MASSASRVGCGATDGIGPPQPRMLARRRADGAVTGRPIRRWRQWRQWRQWRPWRRLGRWRRWAGGADGPAPTLSPWSVRCVLNDAGCGVSAFDTRIAGRQEGAGTAKSAL